MQQQKIQFLENIQKAYIHVIDIKLIIYIRITITQHQLHVQ